MPDPNHLNNSRLLQTNEAPLHYNFEHAIMDDEGAPALHSRTLVEVPVEEDRYATMIAEGGS